MKLPQSKSIFQGLIFVFALVAIYFVFRNGRLDEWFTGLFWDSDADEGWVHKGALWESIAYKGASILTAVWGIVTILVLCLGFIIAKLKPYRSIALFSFLVLLTGPGVVVNAVLKDNWGRPRPRDTVAFSGVEEFQAPFVIGDGKGKSFPCGHCSVGFSLAVFALWNRRRKSGKSHEYFCWGLAVGVGLFFGLARVAVGGHYLSDVITAGVLVIAIAWMFDTWVPAVRRVGVSGGNESGVRIRSENQRKLLIGLSVVGVAGVLLISFAAFPFNKTYVVPVSFKDAVVIPDVDPQLVHVGWSFEKPMNIRWSGDNPVALSLDDVPEVEFQSKGFGFPWSKLVCSAEMVVDEGTDAWVMTIDIDRQGWFTELFVEVALKD